MISTGIWALNVGEQYPEAHGTPHLMITCYYAPYLPVSKSRWHRPKPYPTEMVSDVVHQFDITLNASQGLPERGGM